MNSGIVTPQVAFSTVDFTQIAVNSFFIGFDSDNGGKLSKIDNLGNITVLETTSTPYVEYKALLTQSGTSAPTADVLVDTLPTAGTWSYASDGVYKFTSTGSFANANTVEVIMPGSDMLAYTMTNAPFNIKSASRLDASNIEVRTGQVYYISNAAGGITVPTDTMITSLLKNDLLNYTPITIRVW